MRYLFVFLAAGLFITACRKSKNEQGPGITGVWVESTLRLDTLDFDMQHLMDLSSGYSLAGFQTNSYSDPVLNPNYPVNHSTHYDYYFNHSKDQLSMRSMLSSSTAFQTYNFSMSAGGQRFSIDKFYLRRSLPPTIEFVRIR